MQNFLHEEKIHVKNKKIKIRIKSLYTINMPCVVIEILASYFPYGLKIMSRNTLSEPYTDSALYACLPKERNVGPSKDFP